MTTPELNPITLKEAVLPDTEIREVRQWLRQPAFHIVLKYLAAKRAEHAANVANLTMTDDEVSTVSARDQAIMCRRYDNTIDILIDLSVVDYEFHYSDLKPTAPITKEA
jgi:hypothetical protein